MTRGYFTVRLDGRTSPVRFDSAAVVAQVVATLHRLGVTGAEAVAIFPCDHARYWTMRGYSPYVTVRECRDCGHVWTRRTPPTPTDLRVMADAGRITR